MSRNWGSLRNRPASLTSVVYGFGERYGRAVDVNRRKKARAKATQSRTEQRKRIGKWPQPRKPNPEDRIIAKRYLVAGDCYAFRPSLTWGQNYNFYLQSRYWQILRRRILSHRHRICERCGVSKVHLHVHHLNYQHLNDERYGDVMIVCRRCHDFIHEKGLQPTVPEELAGTRTPIGRTFRPTILATESGAQTESERLQLNAERPSGSAGRYTAPAAVPSRLSQGSRSQGTSPRDEGSTSRAF